MNLLVFLSLITAFVSQSIMVEKITLKNGLKVLLHRNPSKTATILAWVKVGYLDEPDSLVGISHVLEHMLFRGTKKRPGDELLEEIRKLGGYFNASTYYERTIIYITVPKEKIGKATEIMADILFNSRLDPEDLEREKKVIEKEVIRKLNNPSKVAFEKLLDVAFRGEKLGRFRMGYPEDIRKITRDELFKWYKRYYVPNNIILVLSGGIDLDSMEEWIRKKFESFKPYPLIKKTRIQEEVPKPERISIERGSIDETMLLVGFRGVGSKNPSKPVLDLLSFLLGEGYSSILKEKLVFKLKLASRLGTENFSTENAGIFYIKMRLKPEDIYIALRELRKTLHKILTNGIDESTLHIAKMKLGSSLLLENESNLKRALLLAQYEDLGGWELVNEYLMSMEKISSEDIETAVYRFLNPEKAFIFLYLPEEAEIQPDEGKLLDAIGSGFDIVPAYPIKEEVKRVKIKPLFVEKETGEERFTVRNFKGATIIVGENHSFPVVSTGIFFPGGKCEEDELYGITKLAVELALRGTKEKQGDDFARLCDSLGMNIKGIVEEDFFGFEGKMPSSSFEEGFKLLFAVAYRPAMRSEDFTIVKRNLVSSIRAREENIELYSLDMVRKEVFYGSPMAYSQFGEEKSLSSISYENVREWYGERIGMDGSLIIAIGDVNPDSLMSILESVDFNDSRRKKPAKRAPLHSQEQHIIEEKREIGECVVALGMRIPGRNSNDFYPLVLIAEALNGAGGRLWKRLREIEGLSYFFRAGLIASKDEGLFYIMATGERGKSDELRMVLLDELRNLKENGLSSEELESIKTFIRGEYAYYLESSENKLEELARNHFSGLGIGELENFLLKIERLNTEDLTEVARKYLKDIRIFILEGIEREV